MTQINRSPLARNPSPQAATEGAPSSTATEISLPDPTSTPSLATGGGRDGFAGERGTTNLGALDLRGLLANASPQVTAELQKLLGSLGATRGEIASVGDVDVAAPGVAWGVPSATTNQALQSLGKHVLEGSADAGRAVDILRGYALAGRTLQLESAARDLPARSLVSGDSARGVMLDSLLGVLPKSSRAICAKASEALQVVDAKFKEAGVRHPTGLENPAFSGDSQYGGEAGTQWFRPSAYELFGFDGVNMDTVLQGNLGDCYLISTLATMALTNPGAVADLIKYNEENGTYEVTFHKLVPDPDQPGEVMADPSGATVTIEVDPSILVDGEGVPIGAAVVDADNDGFWEIGISVIEKAFALYNDQLAAEYPDFRFGSDPDSTGYDGIEGGFTDWCYEALTGQESGWNVASNMSDAELLDVLSAVNTGEFVGLGTKNDDALWDIGLAPGHAYSVMGTCEVDGETYVVLRNPWGCFEPDPGDGSNDGVFMMPLDDVKQHFDMVAFDADALDGQGGASEFTDVADALQHYVDLTTQYQNNEGGGIDVNTGGQQDDNNDVVPTPPPADTTPYVPSFDIVGVASAYAAGQPNALQSRWEDYVGKMALGGAVDVNAIVQWVLRESYMETTHDLAFYAEKVKFFNSVKKAIRDELTAARNEMANHAGKKDNEVIADYPAKDISADFVGGGVTPVASAELYQGEPVNEKGKLDAYIKGLEERLNSVGDDAQLANVDLQNMLQKQQQTLQMMSNISKMLHDTAMAVIRKVGG